MTMAEGAQLLVLDSWMSLSVCAGEKAPSVASGALICVDFILRSTFAVVCKIVAWLCIP